MADKKEYTYTLVVTEKVNGHETGVVSSTPLANSTQAAKITDFASLQALAENFEQTMLDVENVAGKVIMDTLAPSFTEQSQNTTKKKEAQVTFTSLRGSFKKLIEVEPAFKTNPNTTVYTNAFLNAVYTNQANGLSYRAGSKTNELYHSGHISARTIHDLTSKEGYRIMNDVMQQTSDILRSHGFDPDTAQPLDPSSITAQLSPEVTSCITPTQLAPIVGIYNNNHVEGYKVTSLAFINNFDISSDHLVYISIDDVLVKTQTFDRATPTSKTKKTTSTHKRLSVKERKRRNTLKKQKTKARQEIKAKGAELSQSSYNDEKKYVTTTVAVITWDNNVIPIAAPNLKEAMRAITAALLKNNLLTTKKLVFFTDGASSLKKAIKTHFSYIPHQHILDWYHAAHYLMQLLSMALKGDIPTKREMRSKVIGALWRFDYRGALAFLDEFKKSGQVKNPQKWQAAIDYIKKNIPYLTCYALRQQYHLSNSSNSAERWNQTLVTDRQKGRCMSWSKCGSCALTYIKLAACTNNLGKVIHKDPVNWFAPIPDAA